jgi:hypothetical protein
MNFDHMKISKEEISEIRGNAVSSKSSGNLKEGLALNAKANLGEAMNTVQSATILEKAGTLDSLPQKSMAPVQSSLGVISTIFRSL